MNLPIKPLGWLGMLMIASCSTMPPRDQQTLLQVPAQWTAAKPPHDLLVSGWVSTFADTGLAAIVQEALQHNFDLQAAVARVNVAKEQALIAGVGRWPQLAFTPGYQESKQTYNSNGLETNHYAAFTAQFSLSWEIDLWGRIKAAQSAVQQDAEAVAADWQGARLSLAARTAQNYVELIEVDLQVKVVGQSIQDRRVITDLVRGRFTRGLSRGLDLRLVLTDLANAEAQLAEARNRKQLVMRRLEVLLGRYPSAQVKNAAALPELPAPVAAGLPAELLERRPDLAAAYSRLRAMDERVESAKKALLPRITLTAAGGSSSAALSELIDPRAAAWNLALGLVQPLFSGGRLSGEIRLNEARSVEAINQYRNTALNAYREVEQTLAAENWLRAQAQALQAAVEQTKASRKLAVYSYRQGLIEILTLLDSYRSTLNAQSAHLSVQRQLLTNRIELYLALGGGV